MDDPPKTTKIRENFVPLFWGVAFWNGKLKFYRVERIPNHTRNDQRNTPKFPAAFWENFQINCTDALGLFEWRGSTPTSQHLDRCNDPNMKHTAHRQWKSSMKEAFFFCGANEFGGSERRSKRTPTYPKYPLSAPNDFRKSES